MLDYIVAAGIAALVCAALLVTVGGRGDQTVSAMEAARARRFKFASRVSSTVFDASVLAPLAWTQRVASPRVTVIALVGLGASYLVSYQLARGQALGYTGWESALYRATTAGLLVFALLAGSFEEALLEMPLWVFAAVTAGAAGTRSWVVRTQARQAVPERPP